MLLARANRSLGWKSLFGIGAGAAGLGVYNDEGLRRSVIFWSQAFFKYPKTKIVELKHMQSPKYTAALVVTLAPIAGSTAMDVSAKNAVLHTICPTPIIVTVFHF
jgi:hypothetical protein